MVSTPRDSFDSLISENDNPQITEPEPPSSPAPRNVFRPFTDTINRAQALATAALETDDSEFTYNHNIFYDDKTTIDWMHEFAKERQQRRIAWDTPGVRGQALRLVNTSRRWIILIGTGIAVGLIAASIDITSHWIADIRLGHCQNAFYLSRDSCCTGIATNDPCPDWIEWSSSYFLRYMMYTLICVICATSASVLVITYSPHSKLSGISEIKTILAGYIIKGFMGKWTLLIKSLGLGLAVGSGVWVGKEGPLVHVACCCANLLIRYTSREHNEAQKREILSAAAAAGISVAFGSPIGGVLFSLEQVSYYFPDKTMWHSFVCAMIAAVTLQFINPFRTGKLVLFQVEYDRLWHRFELVPFAILGIFGGLYGAYFIKLNLKYAKMRKTTFIKNFPILEVAVVALVTGLINYPNIYMRLQPSVLLSYLFQECNASTPEALCNLDNWTQSVLLLLSACGLGFLLASYSFGVALPAGIIIPSMCIGALFGRAVGILMAAWHETNREFFLFASCPAEGTCVTPGVYAVVGAASALGGVTRLTISIVVITFELTGALNYVLPIMAGVMVSKWVGDAIGGKRGIYESWIHVLDLPYLDNKDDEPVPVVYVKEFMTGIDDLVVIQTNTPNHVNTIDSLQSTLSSCTFQGFPIVNQDTILQGYIFRSELKFSIDKALLFDHLSGETKCVFESRDADESSCLLLREWVVQAPPTVTSSATLQLVSNMFFKLGLRYICVVDKGKLVGLITKEDLWRLFNSDRLKTMAVPILGTVNDESRRGLLHDDV